MQQPARFGQRLLRFDGWDVLVQWGKIRRGYGGEFPAGTSGRTGRALVAQREQNELFVAGFDSLVSFRPARGRGEREAELVTVEQGSFDGAEWKVRRLLNGDQVFFGLRLGAQGALMRVLLRAS